MIGATIFVGAGGVSFELNGTEIVSRARWAWRILGSEVGVVSLAWSEVAEKQRRERAGGT